MKSALFSSLCFGLHILSASPQWTYDCQWRNRNVVSGMIQKYTGDWLSFIKNQEQFIIQSPTDDGLGLIFPKELWLESIIPHINDFFSFLALAQVSKALNYTIRKDYCDKMLDLVTPSLTLDLVRNSDRMIDMEGLHYMMELLQQARLNQKDKHQLTRLRLRIYHRTHYLDVVKRAFDFTNDPSNIPAVPEAEDIVQGLRLVKGRTYYSKTKDSVDQYIWLPDYDDGLPLLDRFDSRTITAMMASRSTFRSMFFPHLLAQYIIPAFYSENGTSTEELDWIKVSIETKGFLDYIHYLFRALYYFVHNLKTTPRQQNSEYAKIMHFLGRLGFNTRAFNVCRSNWDKWGDQEYQVEEEMWSIIRVAQHWGLDWMRIVWKTKHWCQLSWRIMNGEIPEGLHPQDPITPHDVFKVAFWYETEVKRPTYKIIDEFVVLDKRKRTRERAEETQHNKRQKKEDDMTAMTLMTSGPSHILNTFPPCQSPVMLPAEYTIRNYYQHIPFQPTPHVLTNVQPMQTNVLPQMHLNYNAFLAPSPHNGNQVPIQPAVPTSMTVSRADAHAQLNAMRERFYADFPLCVTYREDMPNIAPVFIETPIHNAMNTDLTTNISLGSNFQSSIYQQWESNP